MSIVEEMDALEKKTKKFINSFYDKIREGETKDISLKTKRLLMNLNDIWDQDLRPEAQDARLPMKERDSKE